MNLCKSALVVLLLGSAGSLAQDRAAVVGGGPVYTIPVGSMHHRFDGAVGWMVFAGKQVSERWTWTGKFEYVRMNDVNESALTKSVTVDDGGVVRRYDVPLSKLSMSFTAAGLTAEAILTLLRVSSLETSCRLGFGFTYWENVQSGYRDSLFVQTPGSSVPVKAAELAVPESRRHDWSGGITVGIDVSVNAAGPVWLTLGADYRLIIGELWQVLDLDMESVSGIQSVSLRGTVSVRF